MSRCCRIAAGVAALTLLLGGCVAQASDRAGGDAGRTARVLTLAQANDDVPAQLRAWADEVARLSQGTLRIEFKQRWRRGQASAEEGVIKDVAKGKADLAWVGARAFDRVGIPSFQPLLAPMLIDSQALQARIFSDGTTATMAKAIDSPRLVGVGVLPGPLRKMLGVTEPFLRPADFAGQAVGLQDGGVAASTLRALGAQPKGLPSGARLTGVDAYEQQLSSIWGNHYELVAGYVTANLNLWPRPLVLFAGRTVMRSLTARQRTALREAVRSSMSTALRESRSEDADAVPQLCRAGMTFPVASPADLQQLRDAVEPVYDALRASPQVGAVLNHIQAAKTRLGAPADSLSCPADQATGGTGSSSPDIPDGTYEVTLTDEEASRCPGDAGIHGGVQVLQLRAGQVRQGERLAADGGPLDLGWLGSYRVFRDRFELHEASTGGVMTALWSFDGRRLTLSDLKNGECGDETVWTTHPWVLLKPAATTTPTSTVPHGTYTTTLTTSDWTSRGLTGKAGAWTVAFEHGDMTMTDPTGKPGFRATYSLFRDRIKAVTGTDTIVARWTLDGDLLTFSEATFPGCSDCAPYAVVLASHAWHQGQP
jgi:TRAP-type C4-dicarboxylate transport system substrate-binding protein